MTKVWENSRPFIFIDTCPNLFLVKFENHLDKQRVMQGCPWLFDSGLFFLKEFDGCIPPSKMDFNRESFWIHMYNLPLASMNEFMENFIGSTFRLVMDYDVGADETGWEKSLHVLIEIDIHQLISRGQTINLSDYSSWIPFTYENLPHLCFRCGKISQDSSFCKKDGNKMNIGSD